MAGDRDGRALGRVSPAISWQRGFGISLGRLRQDGGSFGLTKSRCTAVVNAFAEFAEFLYSPARKEVHGRVGRSRNSPSIHSNCGCAAKYFPAENARPQPEPQRA